jgi:hypothetical protein
MSGICWNRAEFAFILNYAEKYVEFEVFYARTNNRKSILMGRLGVPQQPFILT